MLKKSLLSLVLGICMLSTAFGAVITVSGTITSNTTWTCNNTYLLSGFVYVKSGATLTIEPGTIIKGEKATKGTLIITRTGKIVAQGTSTNPIVFTSNEAIGDRAAGDWGGVIILGNAPVNLYDTVAAVNGQGVIEGGVDNAAGDGKFGGTNAADSSGVFSYVRIEYPGIAFVTNNEINGLTMGGVGSKTKIDHIQVSYSGDDSYEWFGGTVNCSHLIAYRGLDDDFDTDNGFSGNVQFVVGFRDPKVADAAGSSNGFESDNDSRGSDRQPYTSPKFSNVTLVGPLPTLLDTASTYYRRGLHLRRNTYCSVYNAAVLGWPIGMFIESSAAQANATSDSLDVKNILVAGCKRLETLFDTTYILNPANKDSIAINASEAQLTDPFNLRNPNPLPLAGSRLTSGANFSELSGISFFQTVSYRGAFGTTNWMAGWANFNSDSTTYVECPTSVEFVGNAGSINVFPNPFQNDAQIEISLNNEAKVSIQIADINGRIVADVANEVLASGDKTYTVNSANLSPGVYFVNVLIGAEKRTVKLVLNK